MAQTAPALKEWLPSNCSATVVTNPRHSYTPLTYGVANRQRPITQDHVPSHANAGQDQHDDGNAVVAIRSHLSDLSRAAFQDTDGDGVGDLRGIIQRLPHLIELGIHAIWIAPVFRSPMADFGYDVSDYMRHRSAVRFDGRLRRLLVAAHGRVYEVFSTSCPTTPPTSIRGSGKPRARGEIPSATGICGAIPGPTAVRRTIGQEFRRECLGVRLPDRSVLLSCVSCPSSPTSIGVTRRSRRDLRRHAVLAPAWRRRFSRRRDVALIKDDRFRAIRQSALRSGTPPHARYVHSTPQTVLRSTGSSPKCEPHRRIRRSPADRRNLFAARTPGCVLRRRFARSASAVQFYTTDRTLARRHDRKAYRRIRGCAASRRLAQLGARQP